VSTVLAQAAPGGDAGGLMGMLPLFAVMIGVMYFLMIRPQQQKDKKKEEMLSSLAKGDSVVTTGGICGTVVGITDTHVVLKVDDNTKIEFVKHSIALKVNEGEAKK
jgi:preprotein translocase subunit YajC